MKVDILSTKFDACSFYRCNEPARVLSDELDVTSEAKLRGVFQKTTNGPQLVDIKSDADVVVFPRVAKSITLTAMDILQDKGIACVIEMDDDLSNIPSSHAVWKAFSPNYSTGFSWKIALEICRKADWVTVTTDKLATRYGSHGRVSVIPNYIPQSILDITPEASYDETLLWAGHMDSHPKDLESLQNTIKQVTEETGWVFHHLGRGDSKAALNLDDNHHVKHSSIKMDDYFEFLGRFEIGLVPLHDHTFNEAKSWLKGLEYAAMGLPFVASDMPEYRKLQQQGAGITAKRPRNWRSALTDLIQDDTMRQEAGQRNKEIASQLTIEKHAHKFAEAWQQAIDYRRKSV